MIDTQRLGAYLRALMRDDAAVARLRTLPVLAVAPLARLADDADPRARAAAALLDTAVVDARAAPARQDDVVVGRKVPPRDAVDVPGRVGRDVTTPRPPRGDTALPGNTVASAALALSTTGQLLRDVLRVAAAHDSPAMPDAAHNTTAPPARPLLGVPPHSEVATDRLALSIKDTVEFSGLFYESHLAQWADELRPRELLALEPQSKWPPSAEGTTPGTSSTGDTAAPLVRRQLDVLDTGRFLWRGDLWPGQPGALVIEEDDAPPRHDGDTARPAVAARMRVELTLPGLGRVHASLGIVGDSLNVAVRCDEPAAAIALREAAPALRTAIGRRALDVGSIGITDGHA